VGFVYTCAWCVPGLLGCVLKKVPCMLGTARTCQRVCLCVVPGQSCQVSVWGLWGVWMLLIVLDCVQLAAGGAGRGRPYLNLWKLCLLQCSGLALRL
jgi:hypothetical protein